VLQAALLPEFSTRKSDGPAFLRFLIAAVSSRRLNSHLWLQAEACLAPPMLKLASTRRVTRVAVPIDRGGAGLDAVSEEMFGLRRGENGSFSSVMIGPYRFPTACHSPKARTADGNPLLGAIARLLAPSYAALRDQFGLVYESEAALARAARSRQARVCTTYGLFARNTTEESWQTLHPHSSGTTNLPDGNRLALCCEGEGDDS